MVGDQRQVGRDALRASPQGVGEVVDQGVVEAVPQFVLSRQGGLQGLADRLGGGDRQQPTGHSEDRGEVSDGGEQDGQEHARWAGVGEVGQLKMAGQQLGGVGVDGGAGEGILHGTQASFLG